MAEGNRKDPRARVLNMTVRYKSATVDEFIENHSHDISRGGMFIKTRAPFPAGTLLKFEVRIAEDQRLMQGVGRVVWRREPERAEDGFPAGMGIKFIKTGEGAAELISQIIDARQGEESTFEAGARENGADAEAPRSEGARHPAVAAMSEVSEPPHPDAPLLQVDSAAGSLPVEGELRVSSPPKKRMAASETRKVVLQGAAFDAPSSDKTPISAQARAVAAQAAAERAPSRPAPAAKDRSSIVDETTGPTRTRSGAAGKSTRAAKEQQSSPSVYGLVAILAVVALALLFIRLVRGPADEPAAEPAPLVTGTNPNPLPAPSPPVTPSPSAEPELAAPAAETGEGAEEPAPAVAAPSASPSTPPAPSAAGGAAAKPSVSPAAPATGTAAPAAAPAAAPVAAPTKPPAAATAPTAAKPASPVAPLPAKPPAAAAPAAPPKPKLTPKPAPVPGEPTVSNRPSASEAEPAAPGSAGASNAAEPRPGEPAKKHPPAATAPGEPEPPKPAPSPKPAAPSDDNPY